MTDRSRVDAGSRMEPEAGSANPQLSDEQWSLISDLFPVPKPDPRGGRPRLNARHCLEGILWVLRSGRSLEGSTTVVSLVRHLLATICRMVLERGLGPSLGAIAQAAR